MTYMPLRRIFTAARSRYSIESKSGKMANDEAAKLERFLQWLLVNKVELRGCSIKYCDADKGFGIYMSADAPEDGVLLVVPLDLAITPMRVLQDPVIGLEFRKMFEDGDVDDRFLMILFLTVERLLESSSWKPYLDMLPTSFGNPLWFSDEEIEALQGTTLYRASQLQKKKLRDVFDSKVKNLVKKLLLLQGNVDCEVHFQDFLWANAIFWTRALNIPLPRSYVFPAIEDPEKYIPVDTLSLSVTSVDEECGEASEAMNNLKVNEASLVENQVGSSVGPEVEETVWVEGLVPGIDFCNHSLRPGATWEVDGKGSVTGVPVAMYLLSAGQNSFQMDKELTISYGDKGNEELLYLYGFVIDNNPDDYLMIHYPVESLQSVPYSDAKSELLQAQNGEMRCLLPRHLLAHGFFPTTSQNVQNNKCANVSNYSWSGQRRTPSYLSKLIFPAEFLTALRTISMTEDQLYQVSAMLQELVGSEDRQPSETEVRTAVWEACGDSGAFQLLVDLLQTKMMELEEGSGTEDSDTQLLDNALIESTTQSLMCSGETNGSSKHKYMTKNMWSAIVYRRGQKHLTRLFLKEAEHALELALTEEC